MRKAIAIDFDGCLCTDRFPDIGEPNWAVIDRAKQEQRDGAVLILWTCREGQLLQEAVGACQGWGLTFDSVNESLSDWIEEFGTRPRKIGASEYWDDKAVRVPTVPTPNPPLTLEELREMDGEPVWVEEIKHGTGFWGLLSSMTMDRVTFTIAGQLSRYAELRLYGKTWLAYRRKPEVGPV